MDKRAIANYYLEQGESITLDGFIWARLANECDSIAKRLRVGLDIYEVADSEPYATAQEMFDDIERGRFLVSNLNCEHPIWTPEQNVNFRIVHDVLGHSPVQARFNFKGEIAAYLEQSKHHSPLAQRALYTEIVAQTCNYNVNRGRDQRIVLFPDAVIANVKELIA